MLIINVVEGVVLFSRGLFEGPILRKEPGLRRQRRRVFVDENPGQKARVDPHGDDDMVPGCVAVRADDAARLDVAHRGPFPQAQSAAGRLRPTSVVRVQVWLSSS